MKKFFAIFTSLLLVNMAFGQGIEVTVKSYGVTNSVSAKTETNSVEKVATNALAITVGGQASVATPFATSAPNVFVAPAQQQEQPQPQPQPVVVVLVKTSGGHFVERQVVLVQTSGRTLAMLRTTDGGYVEIRDEWVLHPGYNNQGTGYHFGGGGGAPVVQGYSEESMRDVSSGHPHGGVYGARGGGYETKNYSHVVYGGVSFRSNNRGGYWAGGGGAPVTQWYDPTSIQDASSRSNNRGGHRAGGGGAPVSQGYSPATMR